MERKGSAEVADRGSPVAPIVIAAIGALSGVAAAVATGLFALNTGHLTFQNKDRELDIRMVLIGLSILKGDPPPAEDGTPTTDSAGVVSYAGSPSAEDAAEENRKARLYAVHLLERYSGSLASTALRPLDGDFWDSWAASGGVPGPVTEWSGGGSYTSTSYASTYTPSYTDGVTYTTPWRPTGGSDSTGGSSAGSTAVGAVFVYGSCDDIRSAAAQGQPITIAPDLMQLCLK